MKRIVSALALGAAFSVTPVQADATGCLVEHTFHGGLAYICDSTPVVDQVELTATGPAPIIHRWDENTVRPTEAEIVSNPYLQRSYR
jgi:hypothetical protein